MSRELDLAFPLSPVGATAPEAIAGVNDLHARILAIESSEESESPGPYISWPISTHNDCAVCVWLNELHRRVSALEAGDPDPKGSRRGHRGTGSDSGDEESDARRA
jgi:hypothetical protein